MRTTLSHIINTKSSRLDKSPRTIETSSWNSTPPKGRWRQESGTDDNDDMSLVVILLRRDTLWLAGL